ncbi:chromosomal replication initiator protein DnaA [Patescibacteria group bacterium]|nr:chromosomal replication initiator protein DnaA [Patescibacteria group bacterium]
MNHQELWKSTLGELELFISKASFTTWFKNTDIIKIDNGVATVIVPNAFTKAWLENKYHNFIIKALQNISRGQVKEATYLVETLKKPLSKTSSSLTTPLESTKDTPTPNNTLCGLNPRYIFNNFIVGKHNELARAAALAVSEKPGQTYNPLFLYGGVGLGKTHLMQAVGHEVLKKNPGKKVIYAPCEKFTTEFIQAIGSGKTEKFKSTYRTVDLLLIDDIQFLAGKEGTQEEFFHTFNALHQNNKQIILTSDRPPKAIQTLENRLISRFEWGMIADIAPPDLETRVAILEIKCQEKNYSLNHDIIVFLANSIQNNVRELEGALNRIIALDQLNNKPPTLENIKELMGNTLPSANQSLTTKKIIQVVANYFDVNPSELFGNSRKKHLVEPRQIAMYLMRDVLASSFPTIGQELGGRDHTTAMHACSKISQNLTSNPKLQQDINNLKEQFRFS